MEKKLRAEFSKFGKNQAIKSVNPLVGAMAGRAGLAALGRAMATSGPKREFEEKVPQEMRKFMEFAGGLRDNLGLRGQVRPVNSKEIADMARRYAEKDKSVLQDIGQLTKRQQQMVRDEIARQYKKVTALDKAKSIARKIDRTIDPANTGRLGAALVSGVELGEKMKPLVEEQIPTTKLDEVTIMKSKKYSAGGKLGMMYQNGGMTKKQDPPKKMLTADQKFNANAKAREMENLTEMRNALKKSDPDAVAAFDRSLKAKGMMVAKKPVKKMAQGGIVPRATKYTDISKYDLPHAERVAWEEASKKKQVKEMDLKSGKDTGNTIMLKTYIKPKAFAQGGKMKKPGAPNPLNPTKDNNSYISNAGDMSASTKKQMDALRQAMMYFTGVSPKNK
jgi:hypothetical protein